MEPIIIIINQQWKILCCLLLMKAWHWLRKKCSKETSTGSVIYERGSQLPLKSERWAETTKRRCVRSLKRNGNMSDIGKLSRSVKWMFYKKTDWLVREVWGVSQSQTHFSSPDSKLSIPAMMLSISIFNFWKYKTKAFWISSNSNSQSKIIIKENSHLFWWQIHFLISDRAFVPEYHPEDLPYTS